MAPRRHASSAHDPVAIAAFVVAAMLVASLLVGLLVPIYTDEVAWRMMLTRGPLDGGLDRGLGDQCGASATLAAPLFMQPMRHVSAWIAVHLADPRAVRISGVAIALLWVGLFWRLARWLPDGLRAAGRAIGLSLLGLGVLPFLLVWSRPEQPLLIAYTLTLFVALAAGPARGSPLRAWTAALAIVVLGIVALGYHPKAVIYLPISLGAAALSSRGREGRTARIAAIAVLVACGLVAYHYWNLRFGCPGDSVILAMAAHENVASAVEARAPLPPLEDMLRLALPWRYVKMAAPSVDYSYMSDWLPAVPLQPVLGTAWRVAVRAAWYAAICVTAGLLVLGAITAFVRRKIDRRVALSLIVAVTAIGWSATQINKNAYESALQLPLAAIALILALPALPQRFWRAAGACVLPLAALTMISQLLLLGIYGTALAATAARPGPIDNQPNSYVPWGYPALRREIVGAAKTCGIDPLRGPNILVDDLTYFPLIRSWHPLHRVAHFGHWRGAIGDPAAYLHSHGSAGVVVACAYLPAELRAQAKIEGRICCLGPWAGAGH